MSKLCKKNNNVALVHLVELKKLPFLGAEAPLIKGLHFF